MAGRRKWIWMVLAVSAATVCGFGTAAGAAEATTEYAEDNTYIEDPEELEKDAAEEVPDLDKEKADYVAGLIDAIYVQERTADTDAQCEEAKAAWDELTDEQKALVEGEYAGSQCHIVPNASNSGLRHRLFNRVEPPKPIGRRR